MGSTQKNVMKKPKVQMNKISANANKQSPKSYTDKATEMMKKKPETGFLTQKDNVDDGTFKLVPPRDPRIQ